MTRNWFTSVAFILLVAATPWRATAASKFIEQSIAAVPTPAPGEFASPESPVIAFVDALNRNDQDAAMKCFVIQEFYFKVPFAVQAERTGSLSGKTMFPGLDVVQYSKALDGFTSNWFFFNAIRAEVNENTSNLLRTSTLLGYDPAKRAATIAEFESAFREALRTPFSLVSSRVLEVEEVDVIRKAVGSTGNKLLVANLKIANHEMNDIVFALVKLGSNWRILHVTGVTSYVAQPLPARQ